MRNTTYQLKELDYQLNKIGVNLNQLSKRIHSFGGYNIGDNDRELLKQSFGITMQMPGFFTEIYKIINS